MPRRRCPGNDTFHSKTTKVPGFLTTQSKKFVVPLLEIEHGEEMWIICFIKFIPVSFRVASLRLTNLEKIHHSTVLYVFFKAKGTLLQTHHDS
jgi:hypothetical protein